MKELSIFVDESGDFGDYERHCPYYAVSLILHEQNKNISEAVNQLDLAFQTIGLTSHTLHTSPLIRGEKIYADESLNYRVKIFNIFLNFVRKIGIKYKNIILNKKEAGSQNYINGGISKKIALYLRENLEYFSSFDKITIYYDNGQTELKKILVSVFNAVVGGNIEFKKDVSPCDYKLFQAADFICTLGVLEHKLNDGKSLNVSEIYFFESERELYRNYLKRVKKLEF